MPNNKKQRGREGKKKRNQVQQEAKKLADEQQAQRKAEEARRAELAAKTLLRAQMEAALRRRFETWAIDEVITDMSRSLSTTTTITTVAGAATASKPASSSSSTAEKPEEKVVCYHSSSAEHFAADSEFLQMVKSYVSLGKKYYFDAIQQRDVRTNFVNEEDHDKVLLDSEFTNFVFAVAVELYLKSSSEERERYHTCTKAERPSTIIYELDTIIRFGLHIKYSFDPYDTQSLQEQFNNRANGKKYIKDIDTERGLIKCLHREITHYCGCMDSKMVEAKGMEKTERCRGCRNEFPKTLMKKCDRCESVVYCSIECCKYYWRYHQIECENRQKIRAANAMSKTVAIGSQHPSEEESCTHRDGNNGGNSSREEEPATLKGIVHGTCDGSGNIGSCGHEMEDDDTMTTKKIKATVPLDAGDGGGDNEFDMNLFGDDDETLGDTTAVAPSSSSHITNNAMTAAAAPFTSASARGNSGDLPVAAPAHAAVADNAVPADENMINRAINNSVEGKKNANGGAGDGAGGEDDDDDDDDGDDERFARGIRSGGPFDFQSLVLDAKNAREEEPATLKGIIHGTCDGSGNIGSCGHEKEGEIMTTKKVEAKASPPHKNNTAPKRNDDYTHGTSTRKEASIVMEGRNTEFLAATAAAVAVTVPCKTPHPPSELRSNNEGVIKTNNNNNNNYNNNQD